MNETLTGAASLSGLESNLKLTLTADRLGHIRSEVVITPDPATESHRFETGFDQTFLPGLIASCDAIMERFPVIGRPDG
jgi:hypothetical protein